jgi:hypothetical protein
LFRVDFVDWVGLIGASLEFLCRNLLNIYAFYHLQQSFSTCDNQPDCRFLPI